MLAAPFSSSLISVFFLKDEAVFFRWLLYLRRIPVGGLRSFLLTMVLICRTWWTICCCCARVKKQDMGVRGCLCHYLIKNILWFQPLLLLSSKFKSCQHYRTTSAFTAVKNWLTKACSVVTERQNSCSVVVVPHECWRAHIEREDISFDCSFPPTLSQQVVLHCNH